MSRLSRRFYARPSLELAQSLIGRTLVHAAAEGLTAGRIVEVEAYLGESDPSSHAFRGPRPRNKVMFGPPGHLYVYISYGMHHCMNIVAERDGVAGAVLLRAVQPLEGIELMRERRGGVADRDLARGPGRLCQAFGIDRSHDGVDLTKDTIWVEGAPKLHSEVKTSGRVGLRPGQDQPWRFYEPGPWVSASPRT